MKENNLLPLSSEKQLCEAILYWVSENMKTCEQSYPNSVDGHLFLLSKVHYSSKYVGSISVKSILPPSVSAVVY